MIGKFKAWRARRAEEARTREAMARICPPPPTISPERRRIAQLNATLEVVQDTAAYIRDRLKRGEMVADQVWGAALYAGSEDYAGPKVMRGYEAALAGSHAGDCVGLPCTCARCNAEQMFELPSSVTWETKAEGWRLYNAAWGP